MTRTIGDARFSRRRVETALTEAAKKEFAFAQRAARYLALAARRLFLSCVIGVVCGLIGTAFLFAMRFAREFFLANESAATTGFSFRVLYLLPFAGLLIVALYSRCRLAIDAGTNQVLEAIARGEKSGERVSLLLAPAIFIGSTITQFFGGSAGREGAALQLGGCVGLGVGRLFRLDERAARVAILCGISGGFAAVFGAPLTAAIFAIEVACVGIVYYPALLPAVISAAVAASISKAAGFSPFARTLEAFPPFSPALLFRALALGFGCGAVCLLFCGTIRRTTSFFSRRIPNEFARILIGGSLVVGILLATDASLYSGTGLDNIVSALDGDALPYDFLLKTALTALTLAAGFKGGEILPALAVGATFGRVAGPVLGFEGSQGAALGLVALFCGTTNCPLAALALGIELFAPRDLPIFALTCAACYATSGRRGLYSSQASLFSKWSAKTRDERARETLEKDWREEENESELRKKERAN